MSKFPLHLRFSAVEINFYFMQQQASSILAMVHLGALHALVDGSILKSTEKIAGEFSALGIELRSDGIAASMDCLHHDAEKCLNDLTVESAVAAANAAALIFVHAGLESCLDTLLEFTAELDIEKWKAVIPEKKVDIRDILERGVDVVVRERIDSQLASIRRDSVLAKCTLLLRILQPQSTTCAEFAYDQERISRIAE